MKKIHITEAQMTELVRRLNEDGNDSITIKTPNANNDTPPTPQETNQSNMDAKKVAASTGRQVNVQTTYNPNGTINEFASFTKRQLKEARRNKLVADSKKILRKRDIR